MTYKKISHFSPWLSALAISASIFFLPILVSAHEVYVLTKEEIARDLALPPINLFQVALADEHLFIFIALLGILGIICIFGISISKKIEKFIDPIIFRIKPYASHIAQITLGFSLLASAHFGALFGIEIPMLNLFGSYDILVLTILYIGGISVLFGIYPRLGGLLTVIVFIWAVLGAEGTYMLSYLTYLGEAFIVLFFGGGYQLLSWKPRILKRLEKTFEKTKKYEFLMLRVFFSASLIYAAFYAKLIHGNLALDTVNKYNLTNYFHFHPLFIVLGAFLIESAIGIFYMIGFEIRFTSLFFLIFLTMSLVFFGEAVWPHLILIGTAITLFIHGYDEYTIERKLYKIGKKEPVF